MDEGVPVTTDTGERAPAAQHDTWVEQRDALIRGFSGGMLFGIPLLYTMEVWWVGSHSRPPQLLAVLLFTAVPVFLLNRTAGFRGTRDTSTFEALVDTVVALAIGLLSSGFVLLLLREVTTATPMLELVGKVVYEAVPFALGVSVARHFLRGSRQGEDEDQPSPRLDPTLKDAGATVIGSLFIAFNIAPTDEVPMLAAATSPEWLLAVVASSLLISYAIVFEAGFSNMASRRKQEGLLQRPWAETVFAYVLSLLAAAAMLVFFQQISAGAPFADALTKIVVLGLPAAVGGAAGRLAV